MSVYVYVRWAGPSDAESSSIYYIERTYDGDTWTELAAAQAATTPYVSPSTTLSSQVSYGATTVALTDSSSFGANGYAWIEDAQIRWTSNAGNTLSGVTWASGYGTYAATTAVYKAHEMYLDSGLYPTNNAIVHRVTHVKNNIWSGPAYHWYYNPPRPESADHCVVIVNLQADLGIKMQSGVSVTCYITTENQFGDLYGPFLDQNVQPTVNTVATNDLGLAFFHCWRNSRRTGKGGAADSLYTFSVGGQTMTATTIPDRDWVLLKDIVDV